MEGGIREGATRESFDGKKESSREKGGRTKMQELKEKLGKGGGGGECLSQLSWDLPFEILCLVCPTFIDGAFMLYVLLC